MRLLQWLCDDEIAALERYQRLQLDLRERVAQVVLPISPRDLETFFAKHEVAGVLSDWRRFVFLRMIYDQVWWLPVMTFKYDLVTPPVVRIRIALFRSHEDDASRLRAVGFRMETPDPPDGAPGVLGKHTFCHIQLISDLDPTLGRALPDLAWIPTEQPSMPLRADNYLQMCVAGVVALYGGLRLSEIPEQVLTLFAAELRRMGWTSA